ncbi:MAG: CDP-diacylglycerol--glycerol-3-phosphate 3-phosphatidyltransferase [Clostridia bacterium]|nr:CDP-diacylglycerol--glycerol-3-phosphate 3-phosphatidyltransferase [Clostridia bacterium]
MLPNILTIIRIILIPVFVWLFYTDIPHNLDYALIVFITAGITDVLDGYIARKYHLESDLGKVLDPLADKMMLLSVLICLTSTDLIPLWVVLIVMLKEMVMIYGGIYLYFSKVQLIIPSNKYGKIGTILFYFAIFLVLAKFNAMVTKIALYAAVILAIVAFTNYFRIALHLRRESNHKNI